MIAKYTQTTTAYQIVTSCQGDLQKLIGVGNNMWIDWIDRTQKDLFRVSRWEWVKSIRKQFYTTPHQMMYYLGGGVMPGTFNITNVAILNNVATVTVNNNYVIGNGQQAIITGLTNTQLNGVWLLTMATPTQITFSVVTPTNPGGFPNLASVADSGLVNSSVNTLLSCSDFDYLLDGSVINRSVVNTDGTTAGVSIAISYGRLYLTDMPPYDPAGAWIVPAPPTMWMVDTFGTMSLYPPPDQIYCIEFQYDVVRQTVVNLSDVLVTPDNYRDVIVAGVNERAAVYIASQPGMEHFAQAVQYWDGAYQAGKVSMIRDKQNFPRTQFIAPILP